MILVTINHNHDLSLTLTKSSECQSQCFKPSVFSVFMALCSPQHFTESPVMHHSKEAPLSFLNFSPSCHLWKCLPLPGQESLCESGRPTTAESICHNHTYILSLTVHIHELTKSDHTLVNFHFLLRCRLRHCILCKALKKKLIIVFLFSDLIMEESDKVDIDTCS